MKKLIISTLLIFCTTQAFSGEDLKDRPSGFFIDQDQFNGQKTERYHSQLMDKNAYKQHLLFAVDGILSDFCDSDKFSNQQVFTSSNQGFQAFQNAQKKKLDDEKILCGQVEDMPIGSIEKKLAIINIYKDFTCKRNLSKEYNPASEKMDEKVKNDYLLNCLSNPKELTIKELLEYNERQKLAYGQGGVNVVDSVLGTMPPQSFGFNFTAGGFNSSEPSPGVWNFEEDKTGSEFDGQSLDEAINGGAAVIRF